MNPSELDPTPIFEFYRGNFSMELLVVASAHLDLFGKLEKSDAAPEALRRQLGIEERPFQVLTTALRAMGVLDFHSGAFRLTDLSRAFLTPSSPHSIRDYLGMGAQKPGVLEMTTLLRSNKPVGSEEKGKGAAFIYREGIESAMEEEASARRLTLALAGRARVVAPELAAKFPLPEAHLLADVGGGTGLYAIALLQKNPGLRAIVFDRPEVLKLAEEFGAEAGVSARLQCMAGDMFADPLPICDTILLSNVLHDWDWPECRRLVRRCAEALRPGGRLLIHDVLLNDALDGPLPVALYSASLFSVTEGRAYSAKEYRTMLSDAGLLPGDPVPTKVHCAVLPGVKPG